MSHPSFLELDTLALGAGTPALEAHVRRCDRCAAHLARLRDAGALPAWAQPLPKRRSRLPKLRWLGGLLAAGAATAAAAVLLVPAEQPAYVAPKGMPAVAVYVLRDGRTALWNGSDPLRPGDRIRLKVAPEGYGWLAVSTLAPGGAMAPLHRARIDPAAEYLLPESWRLDDAQGPERIHVALDAGPVDPARAAWTTTLEIPREAPR